MTRRRRRRVREVDLTGAKPKPVIHPPPRFARWRPPWRRDQDEFPKGAP